MEKKLDLTFARMVQKKNELTERNARAAAYSASIKERNKGNKGNIMSNIIIAVMFLFIVVLCGAGIVSASATESRYAIASESNNGLHYEYVTERTCEVTEINGDLVTVNYKGELYSFYGDGYEVGTEIICKFTDDWKIVGVAE